MPRPNFCNQKPSILEICLIAAVLLLFAGSAAALHETDHRYEVRGYVLDGNKKALKSVPVTVLLNNNAIGSGRTDGDGFYSIRVHLHDADIGKTLVVRSGSHQAEIIMTATRGDASTPRVHQVNFVAGEVSEEELAGASIPVWAYVAAAPVLIWGVVYVGGMSRRKIRRLKKAGAAASSGKKKKGKSKRKA